MVYELDRKKLNDVCSKELAIPLVINNMTAADVVRLLDVEYRVVPATDVEGIIRASNNYVTVVSGLHHEAWRETSEKQRAAFMSMIINTRWRKTLILPSLQIWDQRITSRCMTVEMQDDAPIPTLNYRTRIEHGGQEGRDGIPQNGSRVSVIVTEDGAEKVVFQTTVPTFAAQETLDLWIKSQGWMTFAEWHAAFPLRYKEGYDEDNEDYHIVTDRLTGKVVIRYDLGDPANTNPEYGGISLSDRFKRKGLNQSERVRLEDCVVKD